VVGGGTGGAVSLFTIAYEGIVAIPQIPVGPTPSALCDAIGAVAEFMVSAVQLDQLLNRFGQSNGGNAKRQWTPREACYWSHAAWQRYKRTKMCESKKKADEHRTTLHLNETSLAP
jgi:hypothetical protein